MDAWGIPDEEKWSLQSEECESDFSENDSLRGKRRSLCSVSSICSFCFLTTGVALTLSFPTIFAWQLNKQMLLVNGTPAFAEWLEPSEAVVTKFYLFSVANSDEILSTKSEKPKLVEMGPYTFLERQRKEIEAWHNENSSVTYRIRRTYQFDREASVGDLSDVVTTINVPMLASAYVSRDSYWTKLMLSSVFSSVGNGVFINRTVGEMLFDGYADEIGSLAEMMGQGVAGDGAPPLDRFGWFYQRNGTTWGDGLFNMHTGEADPEKLGQIHTWNHGTQTNFRGECGQVKGSANGFHPPGLAESAEFLELFSHETCRSLKFNFKSYDVVQKIPTKVFKLDETTFANATINPENACFENNLPSGVHNATKCKMESPAFLSFPHFYLADSFYEEQFQEGSIRAEKQVHESRITVEPTTSIPLEVIIRMQINLRLDPIEDIPQLSNLPRGLYLPAFWFEALAVASDDSASTVSTILTMPTIGRVIGLVMALVGLTGLVASWMLSLKRQRRKPSFPSVENLEEATTSPIIIISSKKSSRKVFIGEQQQKQGSLLAKE